MKLPTLENFLNSSKCKMANGGRSANAIDFRPNFDISRNALASGSAKNLNRELMLRG